MLRLIDPRNRLDDRMMSLRGAANRTPLSLRRHGVQTVTVWYRHHHLFAVRRIGFRVVLRRKHEVR